MSTLLHVSASPRGAASISRRIAGDLVQELCAAAPMLRVVERDLAARPVPFPDATFAAASLRPEASRDDADRAALALSETLIAELDKANLLLVSTSLHNFSVPASLKAWIDHVVRPGRTFRSTPDGKVGLLADRPVLVMVACGGSFGEGTGRQPDFLAPYLEAIFGVIGLHDFQCFKLENCARGDERLRASVGAARNWIYAQCRRLKTHRSIVPSQ